MIDLRKEIENAGAMPDTKGAKIAYQGIEGANSHEAALTMFPKADLRSYSAFEDVFKAVRDGECDYGVLPVENSTAGSVSAVYDLILRYRFYIVGAYNMRIDYCLAGLKQACLEDVEMVISHPQALSQCEEYIASRGYEALSCSNTAVAAKRTAREKRLSLAAICSAKAAAVYGLQPLDEHLQDNPYNTTRFIVISKKLYISDNADKVSLCFSLPHVTGSLFKMLSRFDALGLNLTKIESRTIPGKDFEYLFYLDFSGSVKSEGVTNLLCQLSEELPEFSFLGNYCN